MITPGLKPTFAVANISLVFVFQSSNTITSEFALIVRYAFYDVNLEISVEIWG